MLVATASAHHTFVGLGLLGQASVVAYNSHRCPPVQMLRSGRCSCSAPSCYAGSETLYCRSVVGGNTVANDGNGVVLVVVVVVVVDLDGNSDCEQTVPCLRRSN